jgi:phosphomannomutase
MFPTHALVFKTSDVRAIMGLQDVRADNAVNAGKACGQSATVQLHYSLAL